ncbi:M24 family metallopeptidase [Megalodesulfovibrio gigas]|uniref:Putative peptidase M24 n=1 Tax=Megalodesulfovibrio gigas (strain ATCC 19364 / DSM 1382 / NCIMB 9332 / VKM B-1759) TaxID=1121448 RepID=T2GE81_MEGG1|nr:Xaa-Pro peptidase family protein [Megalodesulfovibrio gigas]AGW14212.1 putative peptidase M24 [Megalodesulfovibrio gigas DSM 1382 = ATCC 19364]
MTHSSAPAVEKASCWTAIEQLPLDECQRRWARARSLLATLVPNAGGLLVFSRVSIYYFTGTLGEGVFWLPLEGAPLLLVRRARERALLETPLTPEQVHLFKSYSQLPGLCSDAGCPLPSAVAVEKSGLPWSIAELLTSRVTGVEFLSGDAVIVKTRAVKTPWELRKLRLAGERHHQALFQDLPTRIAPGMTEREICHRAWDCFFARGHCGNMRMSGREEIFLGHVSAGESANYPSHFNGPVGIRGEHPAVPFMGYAGAVWQPCEPLVCDVGFCLEGYHTDKTQVYWAGPASSIPDQVRRGHEACVDIMLRTAEAMIPGAIPSALYAAALKRAASHGIEDGFMALDNNRVVFLGHGIGLAIDEHPVLAKGFDEPLQEGMVIALEPKLGIRNLGMVGVENTFAVTATGGRCLTGDDYRMLAID